MHARTIVLISVVLSIGGLGCSRANVALEPYGKIFYVEGAGNWGFGTADVRRGLTAAGFEGDVEVFPWSRTLNPLFDIFDTTQAKRAGQRLAASIQTYRAKHPDAQVQVIGFSAGTGVAVWACENLDQNNGIDNLVLLGSALSHDYDMTQAMKGVEGQVYVYHSERDHVLPFLEILGTIDRVATTAAGEIGMYCHTALDRLHNIAWHSTFGALGWSGGHLDCPTAGFMQFEVAPRILPTRIVTAPAGGRIPEES